MILIENSVCAKLNLKRKDSEDANDDYCDFSLSSPARKVRRLDVELPPIFEEETEIPLPYYHCVPSNGVEEQLKPLEIDEFPLVPENEMKAIVPFTPMNGLLINSASKFYVDPSLISSFKNQVLLGAHLNTARNHEENESKGNRGDREMNACRAVIPWVPSQHPDQTVTVVCSQAEVSESMDTEEMEDDTMEIECDGAPSVGEQANEYMCHPTMSQGLTLEQHQWQQQQHCMVPQPPQNITTPIVWYR